MKTVVLPEVAEIVMGQSPPSNTYNTLGEGLPFFQGKTDFGEMYPRVRMYCSAPNKIAVKGDILISVRAPVGPTNLCQERSCIGRGLGAIRPSDRVNGQYLLYFFRYYEPQISQASKGSTFDAITKDDLKRIPLPLPSLPEQQRIAGILSRADRLRQLRRYALAMSDGYLQSVFLEMFGDPATNPMGWEVKILQELIDRFEAGINLPLVSEGSPASHWRVLKVSAVTWGDFNPLESKAIKADVMPNDSWVVKEGDLLMSRANTTELVGAVSIVRRQPPRVLLPDKLWRLCLPEEGFLVLADYLLHVLRQRELRRNIGVLATGSSGSMKNISMNKAATLPIPVPPLEIQERFVQVTSDFERLRAQQREALRQAEHLFQTLLHGAFRGEV